MSDLIKKRIEETCKITGNFILRSGQQTNYYFDKYLLESDPQLLKMTAQEMIVKLVNERGNLNFDYFAGLETGGIPLATMLSQLTNIPTLFVRKTRKTYGTKKIAEGPDFNGKWVCIVEDVITTGGQVRDSFQRLINDGAKIDTTVCAILRDIAGKELIDACGMNLYYAFDFTQKPVDDSVI